MAEILSISPEHIEEISKIENESFGDPWSKRSFFEILEAPFALGFAALEEAEVAGYLVAQRIFPEIEILKIAVKKSERRKKIATELFCALLGHAKAEKAERLILEARRSNIGAIGFYDKLGFEVDGFRENYYANPKEDAVLMSMEIRVEK